METPARPVPHTMLGLIGNRAEVRYLPQSLITDVPRMVAGLRVGQSFSAIPVSGQAVLMGAQAACLLIFVPDTVELAVSGPRSCCSLLERQRAAAGSLPRSSGVGGRTCPVAISITSLAAWLKSRGRFRWVGMERSLLVPGCLCKWLSPERISKEGLRWRAAIREPQVLEGRRGSLFFEYDAGTL